MSGVAAIGIDAGATNVKGVAIDERGEIVSRVTLAVEATPIIDVVRSTLAELGEASSLGLAAPGIVHPDGRSIWWMQGRVAELQGLDWSVALARPVAVLNDAHAALVAEAAHGAAAGCGNVIMLTLGTGVGGAAMVDGKLLRGHLGRAGHLGHISLNPYGPLDIVNTPGSLEEAIGDCTVRRRSGGRYESTLELVSRLDDDNVAAEIWSKSIRALACGLASLVNVLDPEVIILGGGIMAAGERLLAPLRQEMNEVEWRPHGRTARIVPAALGEYAGAIGAAWNAMQQQQQS